MHAAEVFRKAQQVVEKTTVMLSEAKHLLYLTENE
jgi:hypothetical protein